MLIYHLENELTTNVDSPLRKRTDSTRLYTTKKTNWLQTLIYH